MIEFSKALQNARAKTGLSQVAIANLLDISRRNVENWESGLREPPKYVQRAILAELETFSKINNYEVAFQNGQEITESIVVAAPSSQDAVNITREKHGDNITVASVKKIMDDWN